MKVEHFPFLSPDEFAAACAALVQRYADRDWDHGEGHGARWEDCQLKQEHGETYAAIRAHVPMQDDKAHLTEDEEASLQEEDVVDDEIEDDTDDVNPDPSVVALANLFFL
ncbi:MAG: hypothetical protein M1819_002222 [Sarea resinae]|nr:MAG: hypothetical protein M1819_002222 [Sarea resinae]